jgi:hypothetical protein
MSFEKKAVPDKKAAKAVFANQLCFALGGA